MDNQRLVEGEIAALEQRLREGLQHVPAPQGFEDRVMARVRQNQAAAATKRQRQGWFAATRQPSAWWQVAAAAVLLAVGADITYLHHVQQQRQAAEAQAQVDRALQLTSHALDQVQNGLDRSPAGRFTQILFEAGK